MSESVPANERALPPSSRVMPLAILAVIGLVVIGGVVLDQSGVWGSGPKRRVAPDATFYDHDGKPVRLSDYHGKIVLLNFWATWCGPCIEEAPSLDALAARLRNDLPDVVVLAPALDDEGFPAIDPFVEKLRLSNLTVVHDKKKDAFKFGTRKLPETWLISREGEIIERFVGALDWSRPEVFGMLQRVEQLGPEAFDKRSARPSGKQGPNEATR